MNLTWKEIFSQAKVNPSTASWQRDRFIDFFPCAGEGRHRRYGKESVEVLALISSMYSASKTYEEVRERLESIYGVPTNIVVHEEQQLTSTTQQDILNEVRNIFQEEIKTLEDKVDALSQGSQDRDKLLMENIRLLQEKKKRSWWKILT
jgi:DNA-binding transcriptional MerR regulator